VHGAGAVVVAAVWLRLRRLRTGRVLSAGQWCARRPRGLAQVLLLLLVQVWLHLLVVLRVVRGVCAVRVSSVCTRLVQVLLLLLLLVRVLVRVLPLRTQLRTRRLARLQLMQLLLLLLLAHPTPTTCHAHSALLARNWWAARVRIGAAWLLLRLVAVGVHDWSFWSWPLVGFGERASGQTGPTLMLSCVCKCCCPTVSVSLLS